MIVSTFKICSEKLFIFLFQSSRDRLAEKGNECNAPLFTLHWKRGMEVEEEEGEGGILNPGADACGGRYDRPKSSFQLSCGTHPQLFIFHYSFQNGLIFKKMQRVFF